MAAQYSTVQKLALAGMVVGSVMCLVGACAPYWIISDPQGFGEMASLVSKVVKGSLGLFIYCLEVLGETKCESFDTDNDGWFHTTRMGASLCVLGGLLCGGISLCLTCCNCCKRFIVLGILSFLAAAAGGFAVIVFSRNTESFTSSILDFKVSSYGWAYYVFTAGVAILGLVSFMACFSAPENPLRGIVLSQPAAGNQVIVSTSTTTAHAHHPYVPLEEHGGPVVMGPAANTSGLTVVTTNGY